MGDFEGLTLQGIVRFARGIKHDITVVGIRDLDWYYDSLPLKPPLQVRPEMVGFCSRYPAKSLRICSADVGVLRFAGSGEPSPRMCCNRS